MSIKELFSSDDLQKIREVTAQVETDSAGEIVPYLVGRLDDHEAAHWRGAALGAVAASLLAGAIHEFVGFWDITILLWIILPTMLGALLGYALACYPPVTRGLLSPARLEHLTQLRAEAAFLEEQVFRTEKRTGILIFLAVFEHRALILADEGIHQVVPRSVWLEQIEKLVAGIQARRPTDALCETIIACGDILQQYGLKARADERNELLNGLRIKEE